MAKTLRFIRSNTSEMNYGRKLGSVLDMMNEDFTREMKDLSDKAEEAWAGIHHQVTNLTSLPFMSTNGNVKFKCAHYKKNQTGKRLIKCRRYRKPDRIYGFPANAASTETNIVHQGNIIFVHRIAERKRHIDGSDKPSLKNLMRAAVDEQCLFLPAEEVEAGEDLRFPYVDGIYLEGSQVSFYLLDGATTSKRKDVLYDMGSLSLENMDDRIRIICICLLLAKNSIRLHNLFQRCQKIIQITRTKILDSEEETEVSDYQSEDESTSSSSDDEKGGKKKKDKSLMFNNKWLGSRGKGKSKGRRQTKAKGSDEEKDAEAPLEQKLSTYCSWYSIHKEVRCTRRSKCYLLKDSFGRPRFGKFFKTMPSPHMLRLIDLNLDCIPYCLEVVVRSIQQDWLRNVPFVLPQNRPVDYKCPYFMVTEWVDSSTTEMSESLFMIFANGLLEAIEQLHNNGFLHNDIKTDNILFNPNLKQVYLTDLEFVVECKKGESYTSGNYVGHRDFSAPEVLKKYEYSTSSDIFACGRVMEEVRKANGLSLVGKPAYWDLLGEMLSGTPEFRPSARDCFEMLKK